ncbi:MAG: hypothetical protein ACR2IE_19790 [Candidatus Sumerlaeaceae bacterium]
MRSTLTYVAAAAAAVSLYSTSTLAQDATPAAAKATPAYTEPPELTNVSGHIVNADGSGAKAGVAYFIFQSRLNEIPRDNPLDKVKAMAEKSVAIDEGGSFTLTMAPGNYALVYDPAADPASIPGPGAESMAVSKKMSRELVDQRIATIKDNAQNGLPVQNGKIGEAFVVENRYVRPPQVDFGDIILQDEAVVRVLANDASGQPIDFPVALRLRGKNGDIMEPHTPSVSEKGRYSFFDVQPQSYQVFALATRPKPGMGDEVTTPTIKDSQLAFDGDPVEHKVIVEAGKPGATEDPPPPPPPAGADKAPARAGEQEIKRR